MYKWERDMHVHIQCIGDVTLNLIPSILLRSGEKSQLRRLPEPHSSQRRELPQYKQIRAHVRKDDGRMQAYGWSLPARPTPSNVPSSVALSDDKCGPTTANPLGHQSRSFDSEGQQLSQSSPTTGTGKQLPVPVPIYCRPFMEASPSMKVSFCIQHTCHVILYSLFSRKYFYFPSSLATLLKNYVDVFISK